MSNDGYNWNSNGQCPPVQNSWNYGSHQAQYIGQLPNDMQQTYPNHQQLGHAAAPPPPPPPPPYPYSQQSQSQPQGYGAPSLSAPMTTGNNRSVYPQTQPQPHQMYNYMQQPQLQPQSYPQNALHQQHISHPLPPPPPPKQKQRKNSYNQNKNNRKTPKKKNSNLNSRPTIPELDTTCSMHQYSCEVCSVSFPNASALLAHTSSHITCSHPGCSFTASRKVVSAHYKSSHGKYSGRGLKTVRIQTPGSRLEQTFKICVGNHPDDLKAWIAERKKKFPTRERIRQKEENRKRRREEGMVVVSSASCIKKESKEVVKEVDEVDESGASAAVNENENGVCNDQMHKKAKTKDDTETKKPLNALENLANCYDSSSSDDDKDENDNGTESEKRGELSVAASKQTGPASLLHGKEPNATNDDGDDSRNKNSLFKTKQCRFFLRNGTCKNGDSCTYIHDMAQHEAYKANAETRKQMQSQRDRARNEARKEMQRIEAVGGQRGSSGALRCHNGLGGGQTLLRQLLQNDIKRERALCLQLLRYIVDCNFLQEQKCVEKDREDCARKEDT